MTFTIDAEGVAHGSVRLVPSPNFDHRPDGMAIDLLVVHSISLPPGQFGGPEIEALFTNRLDPAAHPYFETIRGLRVSAHFLIGRDGSVTQFVPCSKRAWHAGVSSWQGRERCNDYSIGVELEGTDDTPFDDAQYTSLAALTDALARAYPLAHVAGHSDVAPGRKTDPGTAFDWLRFESSVAADLAFPRR